MTCHCLLYTSRNSGVKMRMAGVTSIKVPDTSRITFMMSRMMYLLPVSYTHLDVYKRQVYISCYEDVNPEVDAEQVLEEVAHNNADVVFALSLIHIYRSRPRQSRKSSRRRPHSRSARCCRLCRCRCRTQMCIRDRGWAVPWKVPPVKIRCFSL